MLTLGKTLDKEWLVKIYIGLLIPVLVIIVKSIGEVRAKNE